MLLIIDYTTQAPTQFQAAGGSVEIPCANKEDGLNKGRAFLAREGLTWKNITRARFVVQDSFLSMIAPAMTPSVQSGMIKWAKEIA